MSKSIFREYGVSEEWLRTGEGERFVPISRSESIAKYQILIKFIPTDVPTSDELKAIAQANESILFDGTVSIDSINWE